VPVSAAGVVRGRRCGENGDQDHQGAQQENDSRFTGQHLPSRHSDVSCEYVGRTEVGRKRFCCMSYHSAIPWATLDLVVGLHDEPAVTARATA
jgi:hypothetical protein